MTAAAAPQDLQAVAQGLAVWISAQKSAAYIRAAIQAWATMDLEPDIGALESQTVTAMLGNVPFVGGLLRAAAKPISSGLQAGTDLTINDIVAILTTPVSGS
ncbi:MAG TPA: hypothetical protein VG248_03340 [Caulobacteraceae bacterium]|jgi:hypothetical protein|nr:hypothetical protein [Caulobacteraceae bacterium]